MILISPNLISTCS